MRPSRRQMLPFARPWTEGSFSVTAALIGMHVATFTALFFIESFGKDRPFELSGLRSLLELSGEGIASGRYWQFGSFMFLQAGWVGAVASLLVLYFAGRELEPIIGPRHFLSLYFLGNLTGGLAHWLFAPAVPLVGIIAGVAATLVAFTTILPELEVTVSLFFVLPVRLKAKHLTGAILLVGALLCVVRTSAEIGPDAMLAGALLGWFYSRRLGFGNPHFFQRYLFQKRQRAAQLERMTPEQFMSAEIDPILDKISRQGLQSLTRKERKLLAQGSEKLGAQTDA